MDLRLPARTLVAVVCLALIGCAANVQPASVADAQMAARVKTALVNDSAVGVHTIEVRVSNGVVRLTGSVPSDEIAARAQALARAVPGVRDVIADLRVGVPLATPAGAPDAAPAGPSSLAASDADLDPRTRRRLLAVGGSVAWQASTYPSLDDGLAIGPLVRLGAGSGLGLAIGFGWFGADVRAATDDVAIGRIRIRPLMAGASYTFRSVASSLSVSLVAGPAINGMTSADRLGAGELALDAANSFAWRPGMSMWFDLSARTAVNVSAGYVVTRPLLTVVSDGNVIRRRLRADTLVIRAGVAYKVF
jgi:hypothetical protein